jgi:hypothetical protein
MIFRPTLLIGCFATMMLGTSRFFQTPLASAFFTLRLMFDEETPNHNKAT